MLRTLLDGHTRFLQDHFVREQALFQRLSGGVHEPTALVISCCDARVVPSVILSAPPGELFVVRNIANVVPPLGDPRGVSVAAALEYALLVLEVPHVIVCGHTGCGGLKAAWEGAEHLPPSLGNVASWLELTAGARDQVSRRGSTDPMRSLVFANVRAQLAHLLSFPMVAEHLDDDKVDIHGWVYELETGKILAYDPERDDFEPLGEDRLGGVDP